jgi:hypothetical protein
MRLLRGHAVVEDLLVGLWCLPRLRKSNIPNTSLMYLTPVVSVKLFSGSISHENEGNQFGHASAVFTMICTALTGVLQVICLNRGLKVYDSIFVVPVFSGVYTTAGYAHIFTALNMRI